MRIISKHAVESSEWSKGSEISVYMRTIHSYQDKSTLASVWPQSNTYWLAWVRSLMVSKLYLFVPIFFFNSPPKIFHLFSSILYENYRLFSTHIKYHQIPYSLKAVKWWPIINRYVWRVFQKDKNHLCLWRTDLPT